MNAEYYKNLLDNVDYSIAEHELLFDDKGNAIDYRYVYANEAFCKSLTMTRDKIIGKTVLELLPNTEKVWIQNAAEVVETGETKSIIDYSQELEEYFAVFYFKSGENKFTTTFKNVTHLINASKKHTKRNVLSSFVGDDTIAYVEFDYVKNTFDYSHQLEDIIGMENITLEDYFTLFVNNIHPLDAKRVLPKINGLREATLDEVAFQSRFLNQKTQEYIWLSVFAYVDERFENREMKIVKGVVKDITFEKSQERRIDNLDEMFKKARQVANISTFYYNFTNNQFTPSEELNNFFGIDNITDINQIRSIVHPEDLPTYDQSTDEIQTAKEGLVTNFRIVQDHEIRYIQSNTFGEFDELDNIFGVFGVLKDNTELIESQQAVEYLANNDVLTGLLNRNNFEHIDKDKLVEDNTCILICDVDGLKLINDAFGHTEGDLLLIQLANILKQAGGDGNVYRIGGDEFVVLIHNSEEDSPIKMEQEIKRRIKKIKMYGVGFDASIGYSIINKNNPFEEAFKNAENFMYRRKLTQRKSRKSSALETIMQTMHEKTSETKEHCNRVGFLASELLRLAGRKRTHEIEAIKLIADVHDIGKISISDKILNKPGKLTKSEYEKIQYHSESGYKIITNIIDNVDIAIGVLHHHEHWDGSGYPHGLKGKDIPLYSRVISICDAYDAMTQVRVYSDKLSIDEAIAELKRCSGTQFDPELVEKFINML